MTTKAEKAVEILKERRLTVEVVGDPERPGLILASCRGSDAVYQLGFDPRRSRWGCTCEASATFHRVCSHLLALQMIATKP